MQRVASRRQLISVAGGLLATTLLVALTGCGGSRRPALASVNGRVVFNGKPVPRATVVFISKGAARHSYGTTNEQGEFTLTTYEPGDGAIIGQNAVTVSPHVGPTTETPPAIPDPETYFRGLKEAEKASRSSTLPARYADEKTSGLSVIVAEGINQPVLELNN